MDGMHDGEQHDRQMRIWVRVTLAITGIVVIGTLALGYLAAGWDRMDAACSQESAVPTGGSPTHLSYDWTWEPLGFTCTWDGEAGGEDVSVTKLWW